MSVDWSQFRDGDKIRVSLEGTYRSDAPDMSEQIVLGNDVRLYLYESHSAGFRDSITSAELIERPFTPPPAGTLFRSGSGALHIAESCGYRTVRTPTGKPVYDDKFHSWSGEYQEFLNSIEVIDV